MKPVEGTRTKIEADLILLAMGFVHPVHEGLLEQLEIHFDSRKNIEINNHMVTNVDKVFGTGDAVNGASLVVTAIASGRKTAWKIDEYLNSGVNL